MASGLVAPAHFVAPRPPSRGAGAGWPGGSDTTMTAALPREQQLTYKKNLLFLNGVVIVRFWLQRINLPFCRLLP